MASPDELVLDLTGYRPYTWQAAFHRSNARYRVIVSCRQAGKTWAGSIEALRLATHPGTEPGLGWCVAPDYPMLDASTMRSFFQWCPPELIAHRDESQHKYTLLDGNIIQFKSASDPETLRGATLKWFWLDEAALLKREAWDIIAACVAATGGRGIMTTTPKPTPWFRELVQDGRHDLEVFKVPVAEVLEPKGHFKVSEEKTLREQYGPLLAAQELDAEFVLLGGRPFFDQGVMLATKPVEPMFDERNGTLLIWELPEPARRYVIGADVAEGTEEGCWSCAEVLEGRSGRHVAELRGKWPTAAFANLLWDLHKSYPGIIAPERNAMGAAVVDKLNELEGKALYRDDKGKAGWHTNAQSRPVMLGDLELALRQRVFVPKSKGLIEEMMAFGWQENGDLKAPEGGADDRVLAMAIAWQVRKTRQQAIQPTSGADESMPHYGFGDESKKEVRGVWTPV